MKRCHVGVAVQGAAHVSAEQRGISSEKKIVGLAESPQCWVDKSHPCPLVGSAWRDTASPAFERRS